MTDVPTIKLNSEERELASRLKNAIDQNGRYRFRLQDMTAGFAAGRNVPAIEARGQIEDMFTETYRCTPHEYLDRYYKRVNERMDRKRQNGPSRSV